MATPLLLGHRGVRKNNCFLENTLAAFDFAIQQGCDGFEFDVRLAAGGQAVIWHDAKFRGREIAKSGCEVLGLPLLSDVLQRFQDNAFLDIELKVGGLESITIDLLRAHPPKRGYAVSSFFPEILEALHAKDPVLPLGLICETRKQLARWSELPVRYVIPKQTFIREKTIDEIHSSGRKVFVWTVNAKSAMKRLTAWGVDGIIGDDPGNLVGMLGGKSNRKP
jgi:glycerophosphoryl diester phosphodiesterase